MHFNARQTPDPIVRAFELAKSGRYQSLDQIIAQLVREDFLNVHRHLSGRYTRGQLRALVRAHAASTHRRDRDGRGAPARTVHPAGD